MRAKHASTSASDVSLPAAIAAAASVAESSFGAFIERRARAPRLALLRLRHSQLGQETPRNVVVLLEVCRGFLRAAITPFPRILVQVLFPLRCLHGPGKCLLPVCHLRWRHVLRPEKYRPAFHHDVEALFAEGADLRQVVRALLRADR